MWTPSVFAMRPILFIAVGISIGYRTHFIAAAVWTSSMLLPTVTYSESYEAEEDEETDQFVHPVSD